RVDGPLQVLDRGAEVAMDGRERGRHDEHVQHDEERPDRGQREDPTLRTAIRCYAGTDHAAAAGRSAGRVPHIDWRRLTPRVSCVLEGSCSPHWACHAARSLVTGAGW